MQESGFVHSAFTFVYESMLGRSNIRNADRSIPPGALISFLQKGLQYVGIEESLNREAAGSKGGAAARNKSPGDMSNVSLLSPQTISALTRENPPIQLNVPPATAAAAVRARLEAEAKIEAERKVQAVQEAAEQALANGARKITGPGSLPAQPFLQDAHTMARNAVANQTMNHHQHQHHHHHPLAPASHQSSASLDSSAGAAALMAQQRREVAVQMAALQEEQLQVQQQLQFQQQLQHEQQLQQQLQQQTEAAAALASVASAGQPPMSSSSNKRSASGNSSGSKKGPKKAKASKLQRQQQHQPPPQPSPSAEDITMSTASQQQTAAPTGFASLGEAVARLEAANNAKSKTSSNGSAEKMESTVTSQQETATATPMEVEENDDQQVSAPARPAHTSSLSSGDKEQQQQQLNGTHTNSSSTTRAPPPLNGINEGAVEVEGHGNSQDSQHPHRKEGGPSKGPDAVIDKEDELTNANPDEVLELDMHSSEVFMCAWNPIYTDIIATGSGDASARIWQMGGKKASDGLGPVRLLPHGTGPKDKKNKDVTTLEWSSDGQLLATGSYDGVARVWSRNGALVHTLRGHKGPIFSLKWNKQGNYLLSGSYDQTTIVWDVSGSTGLIEQQFDDHDAPALDVDWKDNTTFASCSTDKTVHICRVGTPRPLKTYTGHTDEVNAVKWDPSGTLLASCSDDCTAKVWDVGSDRKDPLHDFKLHQQEIYTVKWYVFTNEENIVGRSLCRMYDGSHAFFFLTGVQRDPAQRIRRNNACWLPHRLMDQFDYGTSTMDPAFKYSRGIEIRSTPWPFRRPGVFWRVGPWPVRCTSGMCKKESTFRVSRGKATSLKWRGTRKKAEWPLVSLRTWCASLISTRNQQLPPRC